MGHSSKIKDVVCIHLHAKLHSGKRHVASHYFTDDEVDKSKQDALKQDFQQALRAFVQSISKQHNEKVISSDIEVILVR